MKVCFVCPHSFVKPGGIKNHILELTEEYKKRGIEVKIIIPRRDVKESHEEEIILLGKSLPFNIGGTQGDFCFISNFKEINIILEKEKFDIIHFHNFIPPFSWQILNKSKSINILTFHANIEAIPLLKILIPFFAKKMNNKLRGIIGVAPMTIEYFKNFKGNKKIIPNGINLEKFNPNNEKIKEYVDGKINLLFVGRIEERKGLLYLLKAYKKIQNHNIRLIVVGEGPLKKECDKYIEENNLKNIVFVGKKTGEEVAKYFNTCDIYISPAPFGESFGIVLLEAMASKKPVVGFSNLGYYQLLKGTPGEKFLAKPKDIEELSEKILLLIKNEKLRQEMGEWGLEYSKNYSWNKIASIILEFYNSCKK